MTVDLFFWTVFSHRPRKPKQERIDALNAAAELAKDAATATGNSAARMRACASTIQKRNAQGR
jgi:hypothetical protein